MRLDVKDDLVVADDGGADHEPVVLVVEDAHAPHTAAELVHVLARPDVQRHAARKVKGEVLELSYLGAARRVAVVVRVLAGRLAACARGRARGGAPGAVAAEVVAHLGVSRGRQVHEAGARVHDRGAKVLSVDREAVAIDAHLLDRDVVRARACEGGPQLCALLERIGDSSTEYHRADLVAQANRKDVGRVL